MGLLLCALVLMAPAGALAKEEPLPVHQDPTPSKPMPMPVPETGDKDGAAGSLVEIKVSREEAIAVVRKLFTIPEELGEPNVTIHQSRVNATWSLNWQPSKKQPDMVSVYADVDAVTGEVRSFSQHKGTPDDPTPLSHTRDEAYNLAVEWLNKLAMPYKEQLVYLDSPSAYGFGYYGGPNASYSFRWDRVAHGYNVRDNGVDIAINARTGALERFHLQWRTDLTFKMPEAEVNQDQALAAYRDHLPMRLQYQRFNKPGTDEFEWKLVYQPVTGFYPLVSTDGKLADWSGVPLDMARYGNHRIVPAPAAPYVAPGQPLTRDEALALAKKVAGRTDEPTGSSYREQGEETKTQLWDFSWHPERELKEGEFAVDVQVDVGSGLIIHYSSWGPHKQPTADQQPKISLEEAQEMSIAFIRTYRPDLAGKSVMLVEPAHPKYAGQGMPITNYYLRFQALRDNIPVAGNEVSMDIDAMNGQIRYFWANSSEGLKGEFPAPTGVITPADGVNSALNYQGLTPTWMTPTPAGNGKEPYREPVTEAVIFFGPRRDHNMAALEAKTGAPLDHMGRDLIEMAKRPTDIEGHFAQREIELFWARGIFELKDGKFMPGEMATGADLTRWLVLARGLRPYPSFNFAQSMARGGAPAQEAALKLERSADAPYFGAALQAGILVPEDFAEIDDPFGPITREQLALWAVRSMGYGRIAKMPSRIDLPYADASAIGPKYANAVAVLHGLGIVAGGSDVRFAPDRMITRGEAAKIIFAVASEVRN